MCFGSILVIVCWSKAVNSGIETSVSPNLSLNLNSGTGFELELNIFTMNLPISILHFFSNFLSRNTKAEL